MHTEEPEKGLTYLIESKMSSIVRHTIILWATKEEKEKHWQLNNDKLLIERLITLSEILVCAKKCVLRLKNTVGFPRADIPEISITYRNP